MRKVGRCMRDPHMITDYRDPAFHDDSRVFSAPDDVDDRIKFEKEEADAEEANYYRD